MKKEQLAELKDESAQDNDSPVTEESKTQKVLAGFKNLANKRNLIILGVLIVIIAVGVVLKMTILKSAPKQVYDVAIMVRSQTNPNKAEDRRTSLKIGDALVIQKEGHRWSKIESISYLILKMNLTEEQKMKLMQSEEKEIKFKDLSEEERERIEEEKKRAEEEDREYMEEPRMQTLTARQYRIDMKTFEGFKAVDLMNGQPFQTEVYDWGIVEKKKVVK